MNWSIILAPVFLVIIALLYILFLALSTSYLFILALIGNITQKIKSVYAYVINRIGW